MQDYVLNILLVEDDEVDVMTVQRVLAKSVSSIFYLWQEMVLKR